MVIQDKEISPLLLVASRNELKVAKLGIDYLYINGKDSCLAILELL